MAEAVEELAREWMRLDKDDRSRDEIQKLVEAKDIKELELRLRHRMTFGTAGLRAKMQAGFAFLNPLTIIQTTQGLADYLLAHGDDAKMRGVVVGRDARFNSERFMKLTVATLVAKGIKVYCYNLPVHTPLVPFGVSYLNAAAGVMITASHNPAHDNGYKVYWSNACQIVPPHDAGIARAIAENLEPLPAAWDESAIDDSFLVEGELGQVRDAYYQAVRVAATIHHCPDFKHSSTKFVYTPLHGVGLVFFQHVLAELEISGMHVVSEQAHPDPEFPTVKFPNPEEKGALDAAMSTAESAGISLVLANDPDADRLAVAEKVDGRWRQLSGDQLGILAAAHVFETYPDKDQHAKRKRLAMLSSAVSSAMLGEMARHEGFHHEETLTGFKWLGNRALALEAEGFDVRFAYEEALGYMCPAVVHDKDGVAAAALFLTAVERWRAQGLTPWRKLQSLYDRFGHFADANTYLASPSADVTARAFAAVRELGGKHDHPSHVGKHKIRRWTDLTRGYDSATHDHVPTLPVSSDSEMISVELEHHVRFTARASGTEPKIKLYVDAKGSSMEDAKRKAEDVRDELIASWFEPQRWGLKAAS